MIEKYQNMKILLVDDDKLFRKFLTQKLLKEVKIKIVEAGNPKEAFDFLKKEIPDLVILDMEMPLMDGVTALRLIRRFNPTKELPVVVCTAIITRELLAQLAELNITNFIEKRNPSDVIIEGIKTSLEKITSNKKHT